MIDTSPGNFAVYFLQVALLVSAAAVAASLLRLAIPRARLTFWRLVVFACLLLPLAPGRRIDLVAPAAAPVVASVATATVIEAPRAVPSRTSLGRTLFGLLPWVLTIGVVARAAWLGVGFLRLRRLRR